MYWRVSFKLSWPWNCLFRPYTVWISKVCMNSESLVWAACLESMFGFNILLVRWLSDYANFKTRKKIIPSNSNWNQGRPIALLLHFFAVQISNRTFIISFYVQEESLGVNWLSAAPTLSNDSVRVLRSRRSIKWICSHNSIASSTINVNVNVINNNAIQHFSK